MALHLGLFVFKVAWVDFHSELLELNQYTAYEQILLCYLKKTQITFLSKWLKEKLWRVSEEEMLHVPAGRQV